MTRVSIKVHPQLRRKRLPAKRIVRLFSSISAKGQAKAAYRWCREQRRAGDPDVKKNGGRWFVWTTAMKDGQCIGDLLKRGGNRPPKREWRMVPGRGWRGRSFEAQVRFAAGKLGWQQLCTEAGSERALREILRALSSRKGDDALMRLSAVTHLKRYKRRQRKAGRRHSVQHFCRLPSTQHSFAKHEQSLPKWASLARREGLLALLRDGRGVKPGVKREGAEAYTAVWLIAAYRALRPRVANDNAAWIRCMAIADLAETYCPHSRTLARLAALKHPTLPTAPVYPPRDDDRYIDPTLKDAQWTEPKEACA